MAFLAAAGPALGLLGAGASAIGTLEAGSYQSQVARNNAQIATQNAAYAVQAGRQQADIQSRKGAAQGAAVRAGLAASGVDVNSGSAADVQEGQRETSKLDAETVLNNAELQAYGYTTQATNYTEQASQDEEGAEFGAAGSLLSNASSLSFKWGGGSAASSPGSSGEWAGTGSSI